MLKTEDPHGENRQVDPTISAPPFRTNLDVLLAVEFHIRLNYNRRSK